MNWSFADDVAAVHAALAPDWEKLRGARLFVTGGTGTIGRWLLETLRDADERLGLDVEAIVLTRDPAAFAAKAPHLAYPGFRVLAGDVLSPIPPAGRFTHVIHAATDASADLNARDPRRMFDTIVTGTRRALDLAVAAGAGRFLFLSSGAVGGTQPSDVQQVGEDWTGGPDCRDPGAAYAEAKRAAEMQCAIYGRQLGLDIVTARIFAVLGPLLPLDTHFAAGNFIRDAMAQRPIRIASAGTAVRSYLYLADVATCLWAILLRAEAGATYNIGSEHAVSIAALARRIDAVLGGAGVDVLGRADAGWNPGRYVPSTAAIRRDLGVAETVGLDEAIRRTARWHGWMA